MASLVRSLAVVTPEIARRGGEWAHEAGRGIDTCPLFAMGEEGVVLQREWRAAWAARQQRIHGRTKARKR